MLVGYARVSTDEQDFALQKDALLKEGCKKIFSDKMSGAKSKRPGLNEAINYMREGDVLIVWKLDRLGRSLKQLIETINILEKGKIGFKSLTEEINTTTPGGKLIFHIFGALAEFERNLIRERTKAGLAAARARGRVGGKKKALDSKGQKRLFKLYDDVDPNGVRKYSVKEICQMIGISKATLYVYLKNRK